MNSLNPEEIPPGALVEEAPGMGGVLEDLMEVGKPTFSGRIDSVKQETDLVRLKTIAPWHIKNMHDICHISHKSFVPHKKIIAEKLMRYRQILI